MSKKQGFTLVELLVVVAIIALLLSILLPALGQAREVAKKVVCSSNQKQIHTAMVLYQSDNQGFGYYAKNYGLWEDPIGTDLDPDATYAYWGVAYGKYVDDQKKVFRCPSAKDVDPYPARNGGKFERYQYTTYGLNGYTDSWKLLPESLFTQVGNRKQLKPFYKVENTSERVLFQDAYEHLMDNNGDMLHKYYQYDDWTLDEYYRHLDNVNNMFVDGHADSLDRNTPFPEIWYSGVFKQTSTPR